MTAGWDFLRKIDAQNDAFGRKFSEWVESYNGEGDLDIMDVFGEMMLALDRFVDCKWGCDNDHPEKHLVGTCVSNIRAILPLLACGHPSAAGALFRPLGETTNIMWLLMMSNDDLEAYRNGSKRQRKRKFKASRVRNRLKQILSIVPFDTQAYSLLSNFYLHPNALDHIFGFQTSHHTLPITPEPYKDMCMILLLALIGSTETAFNFRTHMLNDVSEFLHTARPLHARLDEARRAFIQKIIQDPTVDPRTIQSLVNQKSSSDKSHS